MAGELAGEQERAEARAAGQALNLRAARGTVHLRRFQLGCRESQAATAVQVRHPDIADQASYQAPGRGGADLSHEHRCVL